MFPMHKRVQPSCVGGGLSVQYETVRETGLVPRWGRFFDIRNWPLSSGRGGPRNRCCSLAAGDGAGRRGCRDCRRRVGGSIIVEAADRAGSSIFKLFW
jgi:hypothetical protein